MKKQVIQCEFVQFENESELSTEDLNLYRKAKEVSANAYAPYSSFNVGAAVLLENGEIVSGANQENIAYPSGLCAERVALFYAHTKYPTVKVVSIAVYAFSEKFEVKEIVSPCGACRQVIAEYESLSGQPLSVIMGSKGGIIKTTGIDQLLPFQFSSQGLKSY